MLQSVVSPDKLALLEGWSEQAALEVHAKLKTTHPPLPSGCGPAIASATTASTAALAKPAA